MAVIVNPPLLRLFWSIVEENQSQDLLTLSDTALVAVLMQQVSRQILLSGEEVYRLYEYIGSRIPLIRDMADSRQARAFSYAANLLTEDRLATAYPSPAASIVHLAG